MPWQGSHSCSQMYVCINTRQGDHAMHFRDQPPISQRSTATVRSGLMVMVVVVTAVVVLADFSHIS